MQLKQNKWFLLIILALIWGSSFILIKQGLKGLTPIQVGCLRIIFTAFFLLIIGFSTLKKIPKNKWKYIALTALFGTFIPVFLFAYAQTQISSSVSSVLNSLTPMNTILIGVLFFNLPFKKKQLIGVFIGLIGSLLLVYNGALANPNQNYFYTFFILLASLCYATNVNLVSKYLQGISPIEITLGNFICMLFPAIFILFFSEIETTIALPSTQNAMFYIAILGVLGTGIANIIFFRIIQISSPVFATQVTYLIPVVAFCWGLLDHETITLNQIFGAIIVLIGVYLVSKKK